MSSKSIGIEEARGKLGDLVTAAQQGTDIILTRNGRPAARIIRYQEDTMQTATATVNPMTGRIAVTTPDADDTDILHAPTGLIALQGQADPWGVEETSMDRADSLLAEMGWHRVSEWTDVVDIVTCKVTLAETTTAIYTDEGRILVNDSEIATYDADGGTWRDEVRAILHQRGYTTIGDWRTGPAAYDPATIEVQSI